MDRSRAVFLSGRGACGRNGRILVKKIISTINRFFAELSGWMLSLIVLLLLINFITRFFGVGVQGLLELTTFVFVAGIYMGLAHCEETDEHIKVEFIIARVPLKGQKILNIVNYVIAVGIGAVLAYTAGVSALEAYTSGESVPGTSPLPVFPVKFVIFLGLTFFFFQAILHLRDFAGKKR